MQCGPERADYLLRRLATTTRYINTVSTSEEPGYPGDLEMEERIAAYDRWNAAAMITRGSRLGLGGHLATYASAAWLYEVGFNHFFQGGRDQVYFQGHASPGIYARAFLEGRLSEAQLDLFRREPEGGLPSYPHPRSMPDFWQFPTVSMGLGPSTRSIRPGSTAISTTAASRTPRTATYGPSSATARWTSRRPRPPSPWPPVKGSTTSRS